jgi:ABC-2 type transport system ATP-binding protein
MSLIARPSVLFLDEPTTGLDPRSRQDVWALIEELVAAGTTTLLTTQYLDEADHLADQIAVIDRGLVIARGTASELKHRTGGDRVVVVVADPADASRVLDLLASRSSGEGLVEGDGRTVVVPVEELTGAVPEVVRALDQAGIAIADVEVRRSTLDDVFFSLTGRPADEADGDGAPAPADDVPVADAPSPNHDHEARVP